MKKIPEPQLNAARVLTPAELNAIHFGGNHSPISPEQIKELAETHASDLKVSRQEEKNPR